MLVSRREIALAVERGVERRGKCRAHMSAPLCNASNTEYVALSEASQEAIWLQRLLEDLDENVSITINEDNQFCLKLIESDKFSNKTKHIDTKYNFVKDLQRVGTIKYVYCPSESMIAVLLTQVPQIH